MKRNKVSKPRFNLDRDRANRKSESLPASIILVYRYRKDNEGKNLTLKYSIGEKIAPKHWDKRTYRTKNTVNLNLEEKERLDGKIRNIEQIVVEIAKENPFISIADFKKKIDESLNIGTPTRSKDDIKVMEYIDSYVKSSTLGRVIKIENFEVKGRYVHERTVKKYASTQRRLREYESDKGLELQFKDINAEFGTSFASWMYLVYDSSRNTVSKHIQIIKQFATDASTQGFNKTKGYLDKTFKVSRVKTSKHFLEIEELEKLANLDLKDNETWSLIRDWFLISCNTGLRYSDLKALKKKHFFTDEDGFLYIDIDTYKGRTTKDDNQAVIPVLPKLKAMLEKYDYTIPQIPSSQHMNREVKKICKAAGIDREEKHLKSVAGRKVETTINIADVCSNHTGRYTFINIMLNDFDIPPIELKSITGQSLQVLMQYERGDKKKKAKKVYYKVNNRLEKGNLRAV